MTSTVDRRPAGALLAVGLVGLVALLSAAAALGLGRLGATADPEAANPQPQRIAAGDQVTGELVGGRGSLFLLAGADGDRVDIRMEGPGIDPYLRLYGPAEDLMTEDDDSGGELSARITTTLQETGDHLIEASDLGRGAGRFTLTVEVRPPG